MTEFRSFKGACTRLSDTDLPRIGTKIGVGEDELHAFRDVEAAGSGFDRQAGRRSFSSRTSSIFYPGQSERPP
jgi:hypothetical protein